MFDNIDFLFKKVIFNMNPEEQRRLLKLYGNYKNIKLYNDYHELEDKLYAKQSVNNDKEKIKFELQRIMDFLNSNCKIDFELQNRFYFVSKASLIYLNNDEQNVDSNMLKKIINNIILLEIDLGMKVGLYTELCDYFENEIREKYEKRVNERRVKGNG